MIPESLQHLLGGAAFVTLVRGTLVVGAAWAVTALARKLSGETRHLLWLGVIASFLLIPLAWLVAPSIDMGMPRGTAASLRIAAAPALSGPEYTRVFDRTSVGALLSLRPAGQPMDWIPAVLLAVWAAGVLALTSRLVAGTVGLRRLADTGTSDAGLQALGEKVAGELGFRGVFRLILSERCRIPFSFGLLRPAIVLPADAGRWPQVQLESVLTHEITHLRRRDVLTQSLAYGVCILVWFAPPLWLAYAAMLREAETCCDQQVINRGVRGTEYAKSILQLVQSSGGRMLLPATSAALGLNTVMKARIEKLLALRPGGRPFGLREAAKVALVCLCCLIPVLAVFGTAQAQPLAKDDPLFGTWVNPQYDASARYDAAKLVIQQDGYELDYRHIADTKPFGTCWDTVEKKWVDSAGQRWYRFKVVKWCGPSGGGSYQGFSLARISPDGGTIEIVFAEYGYPKDISPTGSYYAIAYRQK